MVQREHELRGCVSALRSCAIPAAIAVCAMLGPLAIDAALSLLPPVPWGAAAVACLVALPVSLGLLWRVTGE